MANIILFSEDKFKFLTEIESLLSTALNSVSLVQAVRVDRAPGVPFGKQPMTILKNAVSFSSVHISLVKNIALPSKAIEILRVGR